MRSNTPAGFLERTTQRGLLCLLLIAAPVFAQQQTADPKPSEPEAAAAENAETATAAEATQQPPEADMEAPAADARPSLDYEPTEAISEDLSVSFPVDI